MSGITLRQDDYDDIAIAINNVVYRKVEQMPNVHHVMVTFDKDDFMRAGISVFKTEMRKGLSPSPPRQRNYNSANQPS